MSGGTVKDLYSRQSFHKRNFICEIGADSLPLSVDAVFPLSNHPEPALK